MEHGLFETFLVPPKMLWWTSLFVIGIFGIMTIVLFYHWNYYGVAKSERLAMKVVFLVIGTGFITAMLLFALSYQYTL